MKKRRKSTQRLCDRLPKESPMIISAPATTVPSGWTVRFGKTTDNSPSPRRNGTFTMDTKVEDGVVWIRWMPSCVTRPCVPIFHRKSTSMIKGIMDWIDDRSAKTNSWIWSRKPPAIFSPDEKVPGGAEMEICMGKLPELLSSFTQVVTGTLLWMFYAPKCSDCMGKRDLFPTCIMWRGGWFLRGVPSLYAENPKR